MGRARRLAGIIRHTSRTPSFGEGDTAARTTRRHAGRGDRILAVDETVHFLSRSFWRSGTSTSDAGLASGRAVASERSAKSRRRRLDCPAHGCPEEKNLQGTARPAARAAQDRGAARQHVPAVRLAEAPASHLPDLRHVQGPRDRAAPPPGSVGRLGRASRSTHWAATEAPDEVVLGALDAAADGIDVTLVRARAGSTPAACRSSRRPSVIEMAEKPAEAVRAKPDSSLVAAVRAVAEDDADAVVSAGNTGAMLAAGPAPPAPPARA